MPKSRNVYSSALLFFIEVSLVLQHVTIDVSLYTAYIFLRFPASVFRKQKSPPFHCNYSLVILDLFITENTQVSVSSADNTEF